MPNCEKINEPALEYYLSLQRVNTYVQDHLEEPISLSTAARIACMENKYSSKFFSKKVGITYSRWLTHLRVRQAIALMSKKDYSITFVAYEVGFNDLRTFERAFKRHTGLTPQEYKTSVRPDTTFNRLAAK